MLINISNLKLTNKIDKYYKNKIERYNKIFTVFK